MRKLLETYCRYRAIIMASKKLKINLVDIENTMQDKAQIAFSKFFDIFLKKGESEELTNKPKLLDNPKKL